METSKRKVVGKAHWKRRALAWTLAAALALPAGIGSATVAYADSKFVERPGIAIEADRGEYETLLDLARLNKIGHVMYIGAHPDDESAAALAYLHDSPLYNVEVSYAVSNWGEGGENAIGAEMYDALGVIRSQELKTAATFDKKTQYYLGMYDSGYTPNLEVQIVDPTDGTKGVWDPNVYVYNVAKLLRLTRPDVVINGHSDSGHAQHRTAHYFAQLGITAAKDPNYEVKDDDGTPLDTWEVKRMVTGTSNGSEAISLYTNRQDPYVPTGFKSYDAKGSNGPITWVNHTYSMIGGQGYNNHMSQSGTRNGQQGEGTVGETASKYFAVAKMSADGYANSGWINDGVNKGTLFAGIDTSLSRVNESLNTADRSATDGDVQQLKSSLDAVVEKFPNGPAREDMIADGAPLSYNKAPGETTVATVKAQVEAVGDDLANATEALVALEKYAEEHSTIKGMQEFQRNLSLVREHVDAFTKNLYGITQTVEVSAEDVYPGQTVTVTTTLSCLTNVFDCEVKFPTEMMKDGLPTTIVVPEGSVVKPLTTNPAAYDAKGKVYGGEMAVKGYAYKYEVTIPEGYQEYTGPFNVPYDEAYHNPSDTYPLGSSDYVKEDFAFEKSDPSTVKPQNRNVKIDITTKLDQPYAIPPILGKADVEITVYKIDGSLGNFFVGSYVEPEVRLVPQISVMVNLESKAVMLRTSDKEQSSALTATITNNTNRIKEVNVTAKAMTTDEITIEERSIGIPAKASREVTLAVTVPGGFEGSPVINVVAVADGQSYNEGYDTINYTKENFDQSNAEIRIPMQMISKQYLYQKADLKLAVAEYQLPDDNIRIGFAGSNIDNIVYNYIKSMYRDPEKADQNCRFLTAEDIAVSGEILAAEFDTIVVGKTAYEATNKSVLNLEQNGKNLIDFANLGGNLVVHYQNYMDSQRVASVPESIAPIPFSLVRYGPGNLCLPACDVYLDPEDVAAHPFYNYPNVIDLKMKDAAGQVNVPEKYGISTADVWEGWKQQRAEWCPNTLEEVTNKGYTVLMAGRDTSAQPLRPGIEYMAMENGGHYYYSSVVWDRQLMDLVPGAFKLYANMISTGYTGRDQQEGIVITPDKQEIVSNADDIVLHIANKNSEQVKSWLAVMGVSGKATIQNKSVAVSVDEEKGTVTISKSDLPINDYEDDYFNVSLSADGFAPVKIKGIFTVSAKEMKLDFVSLASDDAVIVLGEKDLVFSVALSEPTEAEEIPESLSDQVEAEKDANVEPEEPTSEQRDADQALSEEEGADQDAVAEEAEDRDAEDEVSMEKESEAEPSLVEIVESVSFIYKNSQLANRAANDQDSNQKNEDTPEAWLAALKASGQVIINGKTVDQADVQIDEAAGTITISKDAAALVIPGGEKKLTVAFAAPGYDLVKLVNVVTVKTDKDLLPPTGIKAAKSSLDSGKDDFVLNAGKDAETKTWLVALEKDNGVMKINDTVVTFEINVDEGTITVNKASAVLSVEAGSSKALNVVINVKGYEDLTLSNVATVSKAGTTTDPGPTPSGGSSKNKNKDDQVKTEEPKEPVQVAPELSGPSTFGFTFADVVTEGTGKHWAAGAISRLVNKQIINGVAVDGSYYFYPNNQITRAEFTAITVRALGLAQNEKGTFADVAANQWYSEAVAAGVKAGLIQGTGNNQFSPNAPITRQEAMSIMVSALKYKGKEVSVSEADTDQKLSVFSDGKDFSGWAKQSAATAVQEGIIKGDANGKANPQAPLTRAETAQMMVNLLEKL